MRSILLLALILMTQTSVASDIVFVKIRGEITEGTYLEIANAYDFAIKERADIFLVELDTPGGLFSSTQKIIQLFMNSEIPVVVFVGQGSICASAGTLILLSAHIAAVANGTAIGAATPVGMAPGTENKTINYIASYVKDIAKARGRNAEVAEKFVTEALTLSAQEAYELKIVNFLADNRSELIRKLDKMKVQLDGEEIVLDTSHYRVIEVEKPMIAIIYNFISNPTIAAVLLLLGIYLLIFGLTSPGMMAEVAGAIFLLLALAGLGVVDINYLGALLILLGVLFLIAELLTPTYGTLSAASVISIVLGLIILVKEPLMPQEFYDFFPKFALGIGIGIAGLMTFILTRIIRIRKKKSMMGEVVGLRGEVIDFSDGKGFAKVRGEIWSIESEDKLARGDEVVVISRDGLKLRVKKVVGGGAEKRD